MKYYIARVKNHQSIIYLARDDKYAIELATFLKCELYGKDSELISIWNHDDNKEVVIDA